MSELGGSLVSFAVFELLFDLGSGPDEFWFRRREGPGLLSRGMSELRDPLVSCVVFVVLFTLGWGSEKLRFR